MRVYTIADESYETYGHGDFGTEQRIIRQGAYGAGEFPPIFMTKEAAQAWLDSQKYKGGKAVVALELIT